MASHHDGIHTVNVHWMRDHAASNACNGSMVAPFYADERSERSMFSMGDTDCPDVTLSTNHRR